MRTVNLVVMLAVAVIGALLGATNLLLGEHPRHLPLMASLLGLILISLAYALLLANHAAKGLGGQLLVLLLYMVSIAAGFVTCGSLGLVPYTMASERVGFLPALNHVWRTVLTFGVPAVGAYALAVFHLRRRSAALRHLSDQ
ncbi:hypothetical protein [Pseudomonas nitroreducens]|uniref:hypothetical protein n=1 Tax=Pseudomonas nitroreducens TaxID=46680 RepID=UPI0020A04312|nr:hypothetical protein [Pseudomonas nitroreducens]MCP1626276.1 vacuolar-type H+-ATPase subunit I/STV1 [Pseudomonas nitroreducens]